MNCETATERYACAAANGEVNDALLAGSLVQGYGTRFFRLKYANDASQYVECLQWLKERALKLGKRNGWGDPSKVCSTAKRVLDYWLADNCPSCFGRGYRVLPGTPMLSDEVCPICQGKKVSVLQGKGEWLARGYIILGLLKDIEQTDGYEISKKLHGNW